MVLSSEKRNKLVIRELEEMVRYLKDVDGNLANDIIGQNKGQNRLKDIAKRVSEIRVVWQMLDKIIAVLRGEDRELEKERQILLKDAKEYHLGFLKSLAEM